MGSALVAGSEGEQRVSDSPETVILLPVYRPGPRLVGLVTDLPGTARVVVVDDGSGAEAESFLTAAHALGAEVLRLGVNRGKGVALKTGFRHIAEQHPGLDVICADADGQHSAADIARIAERTGEGRIVL